MNYSYLYHSNETSKTRESHIISLTKSDTELIKKTCGETVDIGVFYRLDVPIFIIATGTSLKISGQSKNSCHSSIAFNSLKEEIKNSRALEHGNFKRFKVKIEPIGNEPAVMVTPIEKTK